MFPIAVGAVVPIYNLAALPANYSLILSKRVLARIFMMNITKWSDPQITSLNPEVSMQLKSMANPNIQVVGRADACALSYIWSSYLSTAWSIFAKFVGCSTSPTWLPGTLQVFQEDQMTAVVSNEDGSIGYQDLYRATLYQMSIASILKFNIVVSANLASVQYAASELGMNFGNNGDLPVHLTADLSDAKAVLAWPICGYSYLVMRGRFVRPGTTVDTRQSNFGLGFFHLQFLTQLLGTSCLCPWEKAQDSLCWTNSSLLFNVMASLSFFQSVRLPFEWVRRLPFFDNLKYLFDNAFQVVSPGSSPIIFSLTNNGIDRALDVDVAMVRDIDPPFTLYSASKNLLITELTRIPFVGMAYCFVYNVCGPENLSCLKGGPTLQRLVLSSEMIYKILTGKITYWNDTTIVTLNPEFLMITHLIKMYYTTSTISDLNMMGYAFPEVMSSFVFDPSCLNALLEPTDRMAFLRVMDTPFSFAFLHFDTSVNDANNAELWENPVSVSSVVRLDGREVCPSIDSIGACASDTYERNLHQFNLHQSTSPECYPLSIGYHLITKTHYTESSCDQMSTAFQVAIFLNWILTRGPISSGYMLSMMYPAFLEVDAAYKTSKQQLIALTCNGKSILRVDTTYNYISSWAGPVAWSFSAFNTGVGLALTTWIYKNRKHKVVRLAQPEFLILIIIGSVVTSFSLVPLAQDDYGIEYYDLDENLNLNIPNPKLDTACQSVPWLYLSGFALEFSALYAKVLRLKKILLENSLKRIRLTVCNMLPVICGCLISCWILCALWTGLAPLQWKRFPAQFNSHGVMVDSYGHCVSTQFLGFYLAAALLQAVAMSYGMFLCYQTRNVQEDFVENKWITIVLINMLSTVVLTILLGAFMRQSPSALFAIEMINVLMMSFGVMVVMIVPKIQAVCKNSLLHQ